MRQKMSQKAKARIHVPHSKEAIENMLKACTGRKQKIVICPHCARSGGAATMGRWHFEHCQSNPTLTE
jgi:hypothetical protein